MHFSVYQFLAQKKTKHNGHIRKHTDFSAKTDAHKNIHRITSLQ